MHRIKTPVSAGVELQTSARSTDPEPTHVSAQFAITNSGYGEPSAHSETLDSYINTSVCNLEDPPTSNISLYNFLHLTSQHTLILMHLTFSNLKEYTKHDHQSNP